MCPLCAALHSAQREHILLINLSMALCGIRLHFSYNSSRSCCSVDSGVCCFVTFLPSSSNRCCMEFKSEDTACQSMRALVSRLVVYSCSVLALVLPFHLAIYSLVLSPLGMEERSIDIINLSLGGQCVLDKHIIRPPTERYACP